MIPKEAIILAGGKGTRLMETVPGLPKALAPINGTPFLYFVLQYFISAGIEKFIFAIGHQHEPIEQFLVRNFPALTKRIIVEKEPLGTGGAIRNAIDQAVENTVAIINGDTLYKVRLDSMSAFHHMCGAECTIALKPMKSFNRYGEVVLNKDYSVAAFNEKREIREGLINGGLYLLNKRLFCENEFPDHFSFEEDYLGKKFNERKIYGVRQDGYFIDIGIPEDFKKAQEEFKPEV